MVLAEQGNQLIVKHAELCKKLNLPENIVKSSWESFEKINKNFVLEGESLHWIGCSVFVACRSTETQLSGSTNTKNNINLTSLLRHSNLSFAQFFYNINKLAEMTHLPKEFYEKISYLKDTFGVAYNTFKEYCSVYSKIFVAPNLQDLEQLKPQRNRKQRSIPCNNSKVFEFIWNLFVALKSEDSQCGQDLIKSFHLLYACVDLIFKNAFLANRKDLINPKFDYLPSDWANNSLTYTDAPCIIEYLCKCPSVLTDAMHMKMYVLKNMLVNMFGNKTLQGQEETMTGLLNKDVFELNMKNIVNFYETIQLDRGDFDEKIFLAEYRRQLLEQESKLLSHSETGSDEIFESPRIPSGLITPKKLEGSVTSADRNSLVASRNHSGLIVDRKIGQKITKLNNMLSNRSAGPSDALMLLFSSCRSNPLENINEIVKILENKFTTNYMLNGQQTEEDAKNKLEISKTLFFKLIENILQREMKIRNDVSILMEKDLFYQCMFACSLEIVTFSYGFSKRFPWLLEVLDIQPFHFVKVVELIVRSDQLSRDVIKHLSRVEETIIESLVWKSNSKVWEAIATQGQGIPKFEETALPGHLLYTTNGKSWNVPQGVDSPKPSATDCFQSPVQYIIVNRQPATQHILITDQDGNKKLMPIEDSEKQLNNSDPTPPKKTGSLSILFRKFYKLAGERMEHLCLKLGLTDMELKRKIWTIFEASIRNTDLIKDRHLDQLLMCAIYVICKVSGSALKFQDIMKFYRDQPQSASEVYRDVLLVPEKVDEDGFVTQEKRSDLIYFYNEVYVKVMGKHELVKFQHSEQNSNLILSPLPAIKRDLVSSSIQVIGNVFVKPLESPSATAEMSYNYFFSRSPSKDLRDINKLVNNPSVTGKRLLIEGDDVPPNKRISNRKLQSLIEERKSQNNGE